MPPSKLFKLEMLISRLAREITVDFTLMKQCDVRGYTWPLDQETWVTWGSHLILWASGVCLFVCFILSSGDLGRKELKHESGHHIYWVHTSSQAFVLSTSNLHLFHLPKFSSSYYFWNNNVQYKKLPGLKSLTYSKLNKCQLPFLVFWGNSILFSTVAAPVCIPTNSVIGFPFLYNLISTCCLLICSPWPFWLVWRSIPLWF